MWEQLDTPAVLVDEVVIERNLQRMAHAARERGLALRPHTKTHKSPRLAHRQVGLGADGIMVAKLDEADTMLGAGLRHQSIGYPLIGSIKEDKLVSLVHRGLVARVSVDSVEGVNSLARVFRRTGVPLEAIIEVDTGMHRCGFAEASMVVELAEYIQRTEGVQYMGITCFGGHLAATSAKDEIVHRIRDENQFLQRLVTALEDHHLAPAIVSEGGTIPAAFLDELTVATEIRPGTYIYNDAATVAAHAASWEDCALSVIATVVSKPTPYRAVVDAGSKTIATDGPVAGGYGAVLGLPEYRLTRLSEEHGVLEAADPLPFAIGEQVQVIPNHACTTVNLHDQITLIRDNDVVGVITTAARGRVR